MKSLSLGFFCMSIEMGELTQLGLPARLTGIILWNSLSKKGSILSYQRFNGDSGKAIAIL